jgi:sentrin-specific protease 1
MGTEMIIGASVDVKHRVKAHLVLRKSLIAGCNMREVVTNTTVSVTGVAIQILLGDISTLRRGKWLNDKIIDLVMGRIQEEARGRSGVKADLYMSTYFYNILCAREHRGTLQLTRKNKVDEGTRIFTIVNTRNASHWVAVEICCVQKKVTVIDSILPSEGSAEYDELFLISKKVEMWADTEAKLVKEGRGGAVGTLACLSSTPSWTFECCKQSPQQANGCDCGLFALASVAARSKGAEKHSIFDMQEQRNYLAAWIISLHNDQ